MNWNRARRVVCGGWRGIAVVDPPAHNPPPPVPPGNKERYQLGGIRSDIAQRRQKLARANQLFRESNQTPSIEILVASAEDTEDDIEDQMDMSFNSPRSSTPVYQHEPTFDIDTLTPAAAAVPQIPQTDGGSKARDATGTRAMIRT